MLGNVYFLYNHTEYDTIISIYMLYIETTADIYSVLSKICHVPLWISWEIDAWVLLEISDTWEIDDVRNKCFTVSKYSVLISHEQIK